MIDKMSPLIHDEDLDAEDVSEKIRELDELKNTLFILLLVRK